MEGLSKKDFVLDDLDQMLLSLNKMEKQLHIEVNKHISTEGNKSINKIKRIENNLLSIEKAIHNKTEEKTSRFEKDHSFHLTLSY
ncbi:hypothetical protein ACLM5H_04240 [Fredinandcohnia humi]